MVVDLEKTRKLSRIVESLIELNNCENNLDEEVLDNYIQKALSLTPVNFIEEEIGAVKRDITWKYKIYTIPGESIVENYNNEEWYTNCKNEIEQKFWSRYKNYLIDNKKFSPNIVSTLGDDTLDIKLMNYIGDPKSDINFLIRGLIIGDVQSGKTSTYIGLMCKAADAGYKVFILLTGTIESLRKQTQERVEEGFVGIDMSADTTGGRRVGVGLDNKDIFAMTMTSRKADFIGNVDKLAVSLGNKEAIVFVIKKNTTVLKKLTDWLISLNADPITQKIDVPMLLIDDEADNASINTSADKEDPTKINKMIRNLVDIFTKSNYVGFTATPFANVFIDPETTAEMVTHDLFPENFIVALPTPSNYIGPSDIFSDTGKYHSQLIYIEDAGRVEEDGWSFYFKHSKNWDDDLPSSLTDAIYTFYIVNAIRDLRGDLKDHRSMLINISRFVSVQQCIKGKIEEIHKNAYGSLKYNLGKDLNRSLRDPIIKRIYNIWLKEFSSIEFTWNQISEIIFNSMENIQIKVVNSSKSSEKLDYSKNDSLRVIAIGGLALSRGLTLEGLVISYFYRNTCTYDVLMQMGRWFGYRKGYEDLFRIWTHSDSAKWYAEIAEATNNLKEDMSRMRELELKPKDFGIRVRNDSDELNITAKNKMRNTTDEIEFTSYFGGIVETPYLCSDVKVQKKNFILISDLVKECLEQGLIFEKMIGSGEHYVLQDVPKIKVISLINKIKVSNFCANFDTIQIYDFLSNCTESSIDKWDIAFMDGNKNDLKDEDIVNICGRKIIKVKRLNCEITPTENRLKIGQRGKLGGPSDGIIGIKDTDKYTKNEIIENAKELYRDYYLKTNEQPFTSNKKYPSETWFKFVENRKPLLLIYFIDVFDNENHSQLIEKYRNEMNNIPSTGFAIGIPKNDRAASMTQTKYKANKIYNWFEKDEIFLEEQEE